MDFPSCAPNTGPTPEAVKALDEAITKARANFKDLTKSENNPHFNSSYASLEAVLEAVLEPLAAQNITIETAGVWIGERFTFCTTIRHSDGGFKSSYFPVMDPSPQKVGGAETYAQRYNICGLLAITGGKDDDGNTAMGKSSQNGKANRKPAAAAAGNGADSFGF